jgi:putative intracellular protease/amidase
MSKTRILFVLTGHDRLGPAHDTTAAPTGFHLTEAACPWAILTDAGLAVDLVTPDGGAAPIDPSSRDDSDAVNRRFLDDADVQRAVKNSRALSSVSLDDYAGLYFPGGHGTMWDLADHSAVIEAVRTFFESGRPVAAVCHGPAAFVNVRLSTGRWLVEGRELSVFTDREERQTGKDALMPFMLASALENRGARLRSAENFEACIAIDDNLISGQNPASAEGVAQALLQRLESA